MKEFLFLISNINDDTLKLVKVVEANRELAKEKFAKAFSSLLDLNYDEIYRMCDYQDIEITCVELTDIITL